MGFVMYDQDNKRPRFYIPIILWIILGVALIAGALLGLSSIVCGLACGAQWSNWWPHISLSFIENFIHSFGMWGVFASIALMVMHSFLPFPAELVAIANGMIFGPLWGTVITWVGAMLGAFTAFGLVRMLGRPFILRIMSATQAQRVDYWVDRYSCNDTLLMVRLIPIIAFNLINYAAGLTSISWWTFAWTTGIGILPLTAMMVILGDQIQNLSWQIWLILLIIGSSIWALTHRMHRRSLNSHGNTSSIG